MMTRQTFSRHRLFLLRAFVRAEKLASGCLGSSVRAWLLPWVGLSSLWGSLNAAEDEYAFFNERIAPLLKEHCLKCHSHEAGKSKGGLVLDSKAGWMTGGDSGQAIIPGDPANSILYQAVSYEDPFLEMPEKGKLPDEAIEAFRKWIEQGAHDPRESFQAVEKESMQVSAEELWSFQPIRDVEIPKDHSGHPIDYFVNFRVDHGRLVRSTV